MIRLPTPSGLRERLRRDTRHAHDSLDASLDLIGPPLRLAQFIRLLGRFHALHRAVEPALAASLEPSLLAGRGKLAALEHDLRLCGADTTDVITSAAPNLPPLTDRAAALGALYVIEGSTLGGRIIARHLRQENVIPPDALRYFDIYGGQTGEMWRIICRALDAIVDSEEAERSVRMAIAMFGMVQAWMASAHWRDPAPISQDTDGGRDRI